MTTSSLLILAAASGAWAQTSDPVDMLSIQDLLNVEVVSAASKFAQETTKAPASITIVTGEEIRRFGHRTLADTLRSVRGLHVNDDRNYSYAGVRGFGRPGDYNTRLLLLVDGHRLNDPIYDQAPIGNDFPVDVETIERVEIIRGPGSALYGTSAFFAVINVVTRTGRQQDGARVAAEGGNLDAVRGRASVGRVFQNGVDLMLGASFQDVGGPGQLHFPEFDAPEMGDGIVRGNDRDEVGRVFASMAFRQMTFRGGFGDRRKRVPTASFGTVFGDSRLDTRDARGFADLSYTGSFGGGWSGVLRGSYDRYHYDGRYPYDYGDLGVLVFEDWARSDWVGAEFTANRRIKVRHLITAGFEGRQSLRQDQYSRVDGELTIQDDRLTGTWGLYLQDEFSLTSKIIVNGGARLDHFGTFGTQVTPRAALIFNPAAGTALKVMHGRAFRAPNAYELYYYSSDLQDPTTLRPETIRTSEAVWEQNFGRRLRSTVSVFHTDIHDLISQGGDGDDLYFINASGAISRGVEAEIDARLAGGLMARASHAWTRGTDHESGSRLSNSPANLAKLSLGLPVPRTQFFVATGGWYVGERLSVQGGPVAGYYVQNATVTADRLARNLDLSFAVYNLFDRQYGDPGGEEHLQTQIPQDGRSFRVRLTMRF